MPGRKLVLTGRDLANDVPIKTFATRGPFLGILYWYPKSRLIGIP